eukprot:Awhi_evm1s13590
MDRLTVSGVATILAKKSQSGLDIDLDDKQVGFRYFGSKPQVKHVEYLERNEKKRMGGVGA